MIISLYFQNKIQIFQTSCNTVSFNDIVAIYFYNSFPTPLRYFPFYKLVHFFFLKVDLLLAKSELIAHLTFTSFSKLLFVK